MLKINSKYSDFLKLVIESGEAVLKIYEKTPKIYEKKDKSLVTDADLASERVIVSGLKKSGFMVLSEESEDDQTRIKEEKVWVLDPLDGTLDFIQKTGDFSIMLGLVEKGKPVFGVVLVPTKQILYFAEKGRGAFIQNNGKTRRLKVSGVSKLKDSSFVMSKNHLSSKEREFVETKKIKGASHRGSIGVKLGLIAEGKADGYMNVSNKTFEWDICASDIILSEAGGKTTDLNGKSFVYNKSNPRNKKGILATNGKIHSLMTAELNGAI